VKCPHCEGVGRVTRDATIIEYEVDCEPCNATGEVPDRYEVKVEECAEAHTWRTGHLAGGSHGYADCGGCGEEWHWPITEQQYEQYLTDLWERPPAK
jgi:hypothetical protein